MTWRPAARDSSLMVESDSQSGVRGSMNPGSGLEPTTLSTAIFSGSGASSIKGVASIPNRNIPAMCAQKGLAWRKRREKSLLSV